MFYKCLELQCCLLSVHLQYDVQDDFSFSAQKLPFDEAYAYN